MDWVDPFHTHGCWLNFLLVKTFHVCLFRNLIVWFQILSTFRLWLLFLVIKDGNGNLGFIDGFEYRTHCIPQFVAKY